MYRYSKLFVAPVALVLSFPAGGSRRSEPAQRQPSKLPADAPSVLWRDPADIASRNLFYGPGGKAREPRGPFKFDKELAEGSSPKFDVIDQDGVKWRVKLGNEARPETVASRLVWAVGYFANEDYFVPALRVQNLPHLKRGQSFVSPDGTIRDARLKRHPEDQKKAGPWAWAKNPFVDTQPWNGLRVLMAVMNNWDLKDVNNAVYEVQGEHPERRYVVSDLGASFGTTGLNWTNKGDLKAYCRSKLIKNVSGNFVTFTSPSGPPARFFFDISEIPRRVGLLWLGRHIPVADAVWMGHLLAQLTPDQIRDAVRAGGYSPSEVETLSTELQRRIHELVALENNKVATTRPGH